MRINDFEKFPVGHVVFPVMRGWEGGVYPKIGRQAIAESIKRLDITEGRVHSRIAMTKVPVGHDEFAIIGQQLLYLGKFLRLNPPKYSKAPWATTISKRLPLNSIGFSVRSDSIRFGPGSCMAMSIP